jgi:hypothetical protein
VGSGVGDPVEGISEAIGALVGGKKGRKSAGGAPTPLFEPPSDEDALEESLLRLPAATKAPTATQIAVSRMIDSTMITKLKRLPNHPFLVGAADAPIAAADRVFFSEDSVVVEDPTTIMLGGRAVVLDRWGVLVCDGSGALRLVGDVSGVDKS